MTVPTCGVSHDVVIYDGLGNLDPVGLIIKPFSYRVMEAPNLVPRMAMGDPKGTDYLGYTSWVQEDFRGGRGQVRAPMPANNRYFEARRLLPQREEGYMGVCVESVPSSIDNLSAMTTAIDYSGLNLVYARRQDRFWYIPGVAWDSDYDRTMIIAWRGAWLRGWPQTPQPTVRVAYWGTEAAGGLSAIDACKYSTVAVIALQESCAGYVKPTKIAVQWSSTWSLLAVSATYTGNLGAAAVTTYDGRLWKGDWEEPRVAWYDIESVNDSIQPTWSDYVSVGTAGKILKMTPFMGRLFIAKSNGIWAYEAGRTYQVVDLTERADGHPYYHNDFNIFLEAHGSLYWNIGNRLMRYTSGGLLEEMVGHFDDAPLAAMPVRRGLGLVTPYKVWVLDTAMGGLYEVAESDATRIYGFGAHAGWMFVTPYRQGGVWAGADYGAQTGMAMFPYDDDFTMAGEPCFKPRAHTGGVAGPGYYLMTSFVDLGRPSLVKAWRHLVVRYQGVATTSWPQMAVFYRMMEQVWDTAALPKMPIGPSWTSIGVLSATTETDIAQEKGVAVFSFPSSVASRAIQAAVVLYRGATLYSTDSRPAIFSIELEGEPIRTVGRLQRRKQYRFNAVVVDDMELLTGEVENSAAHVAAALYSFAGTGTTHVVALPFPPPVGHTVEARVELGATGAVVPVLPSSYSVLPSGCPGSDISVVITEI